METLSLADLKSLFCRIASGEEDAFRFLFEKYRLRIYQFARNIVASQTIAEEVVQEVFMKLWVSRVALNNVDDPDAYLFIVARNRALDHLRREANHRDLKVTGVQLFTGHDHSTEDELLFRESRRLIEEAISQLPEQQNKVYILAKREGLTREAIAVQLGLSQHTVKNHLSAAMQKIRDHLTRNNAMVLFFFSAGVLF